MGPEPNKKWASDSKHLPPSLSSQFLRPAVLGPANP